MSRPTLGERIAQFVTNLFSVFERNRCDRCGEKSDKLIQIAGRDKHGRRREARVCLDCVRNNNWNEGERR